MCSYGQLSEVQIIRDLDLGWGQCHFNIHSMCRTRSLPNNVTIASCTTEIWPSEFREISTLDEVWTPVIAFLETNSKIGLRQAVVHVPYYITTNHQFWAPRKNSRGDRPTKVQLSQLRKLRDLDLRSGRDHTDVHNFIWSRSTQTPNQMEIGKTFCGCTYRRMDRHTWVLIY